MGKLSDLQKLFDPFLEASVDGDEEFESLSQKILALFASLTPAKRTLTLLRKKAVGGDFEAQANDETWNGFVECLIGRMEMADDVFAGWVPILRASAGSAIAKSDVKHDSKRDPRKKDAGSHSVLRDLKTWGFRVQL